AGFSHTTSRIEMMNATDAITATLTNILEPLPKPRQRAIYEEITARYSQLGSDGAELLTSVLREIVNRAVLPAKFKLTLMYNSTGGMGADVDIIDAIYRSSGSLIDSGMVRDGSELDGQRLLHAEFPTKKSANGAAKEIEQLMGGRKFV